MKKAHIQFLYKIESYFKHTEEFWGDSEGVDCTCKQCFKGYHTQTSPVVFLVQLAIPVPEAMSEASYILPGVKR